MKKKELSSLAKEMGKLGGKTTMKKYGKEHFKKMNEIRWAKNKKNGNNKKEK